MKITYHIPTEQYGFVELEKPLEEGDEIMSYGEVKRSVYPNGDGLTDKEFNKALDRYLLEGDMDSEAYAQMSEGQKDVIQCLKRANKRLKAREDDEKPPF